MLSTVYWIVLSLLVISLSHHLYTSVLQKTPERTRTRNDDDDDEESMREELTAYVNSLKK